MQHVETIIIGAGPAGTACARRLHMSGHDVLLLDKAVFPRLKLCAGWVTAKALEDLEVTPADYPHPIIELEIRSHIKGLPFAWRGVPTPGANYSIRRIEFDNWLLERSGAPLVEHRVKNIRNEGDRYIIDDEFACRFLVGAGGTACPVRRIFFPDNRRKFRQVVTLEREFRYPARVDICHLYFGHYGTKAYAWYFPKGDGYVNIGLGGKANYFKKTGISIHQHFTRFLADIVDDGLLDSETVANFGETGHPYYLNSGHGRVSMDRCYLIGDSAGLATVDLGEGIGPAIESAILAADEIMGKGQYVKQDVSEFSTSGVAQKIASLLIAPKPA